MYRLLQDGVQCTDGLKHIPEHRIYHMKWNKQYSLIVQEMCCHLDCDSDDSLKVEVAHISDTFIPITKLCVIMSQKTAIFTVAPMRISDLIHCTVKSGTECFVILLCLE